MAISRAQLAKELEPGLNALFGLEFGRYENEHSEIFDEESSDRAFEEEVMLGGFATAPVKSEGGAISFDDAQETYTARYTHETIALATGNSGSTSTGLSSATADLNTIATTNTLALRIMGILDDPANNDFTSAGIPLIVRINNHFNAPTGSIAAGTVSTTGV